MKQTELFKTKNEWFDEWLEMPEYNNVKKEQPLITATFKFRTEEDYIKFKDLVQEFVFNGEKVFDGMQKKDKKSSWYPHNQKASKYEYI
jgi:hypothetical protein